MRKLLIIPLAIFLAYFGWALSGAWQLRAAVKARDMAAIESSVDWTTLRANLKKTIGIGLKEASESPEHGLFTRTLLRALGHLAADTAIDLAVTPQTLAYVLAGHIMLDDITRPHEETPDAKIAEDDNDPLSPRRLRWAFFEGPGRLRLETVDPALPGKRVVSILALQGLSWKLVDVYYVTV
jgi:hypothetical protein